MQHMEYREACVVLRKAGLTEVEIERLSQLRRAYSEEEVYLMPPTHQSLTHESWFERAMRKIPSLCWSLADRGSVFWSQYHFTH